MHRHILSILVDNRSGVLSRVVGLFSRRGYNIDSLSVGVTHKPDFSRITVATRGDDMIIEQIRKQVGKLIDVVEIIELKQEQYVSRELALIKINVSNEDRSQIVSIVDIFRGNIVDVSNSTITIEITGDQSKIAALCELLKTYGILEMVRTGLTALERGANYINGGYENGESLLSNRL